MIQKLAKLLGIDRFVLIGGALLILVIAGGAWLALHDSKVIRQHDDAANVKVLEGKVEALETAGTQSSERGADFSAQQAADKKGIDDAKANGSSPFDGMFGSLQSGSKDNDKQAAR